jgi:CBS domain-containing protein
LPLNLFGRISVPHSGPHAEACNVKHHAARPIVDACRLLALENGITATPTLTRLEAADRAGAVPAEDARDLAAAFKEIQEMRLRAQLQAVTAGQEPDNFLSPKALQRAERAALREHLHTVGRFQDAIRLRYAVQLRAV